MKKTRSAGVTVFGIIIILLSIPVSLSFILEKYVLPTHFDKYVSSFYFILNIVFFISGIGILKLKETFRKLVITLAIYMYLLKHIVYYIRCLAYYGFTSQATPCILKHVNYLVLGDFIMGIVIIYFFTRPSVTKQFKNISLSKTSDNTGYTEN